MPWAEVAEEGLRAGTCFDSFTDRSLVSGLIGSGERKKVSVLSNWPEGGFVTEKVSLGQGLGIGGGHRSRGSITVKNAE